MKTNPIKLIVVAGLVTAFTIQCSKSSGGNSPDTGGDSTGNDTQKIVRQIVLADQSTNRVIIADIDNKQVLANASTGGVALIRIADKKTVFYAYGGNGNVHSAEVLPDGNIVIAASTGNYLMLLKTDTSAYPFNGYTKKVTVADAHNVVWDKKRQVLWTASKNKLYSFTYNFNCAAPDLTLTDCTTLPASGSHDLFPLYGMDSLWLSTSSKIWAISLGNKAVTEQSALARVKSVSSGPGEKYPVILLQSIDTDKQWYNDKVIDMKGNTVYQLNGLKAYKARWMLHSSFSYDDNGVVRICK
jgi:hypothetical protein